MKASCTLELCFPLLSRPPESTTEVVHTLPRGIASSFSFSFLGLHLWHMEGPGPGVELERQLLACADTGSEP